MRHCTKHKAGHRAVFDVVGKSSSELRSFTLKSLREVKGLPVSGVGIRSGDTGWMVMLSRRMLEMWYRSGAMLVSSSAF